MLENIHELQAASEMILK